MDNEVVPGRPASLLSPWVRGYRGFSWAGGEPGVHRGLPSGNLVFILSLSDPTNVVEMPGAQSPARFHALLGGLHTRAAVIAHHGHGAGIEVEITPLGCRSLFGMPAGALANTLLEADEILGARGTELVERLHAAPTWAARFAVIDEALTRALQPPPTIRPEVTAAWDLIQQTGGRARIADVASHLGWSRRHLSEHFSAEFGITMKATARIARFERTCGLLDRGMSLSEAAAVGGFSDQAHLTTEWRDLAGVTPATWLDDGLRHRPDPHEVT